MEHDVQSTTVLERETANLQLHAAHGPEQPQRVEQEVASALKDETSCHVYVDDMWFVFGIMRRREDSNVCSWYELLSTGTDEAEGDVGRRRRAALWARPDAE